MKLAELLEKTEYTVVSGNVDVEVKELQYDSRKVTRGDVFVCISGAVVDGHDFITDVIAKGAAAVIVERDTQGIETADAVIIRTPDTRLALAYMSAAFFDYPAEKLFTIGITGTKGKTTTTFMVRDILEACNIKTGLIGTIETIIGDTHIPSANTTPESYMVQKYFRDMADAGCRCVVMEVSSQALMLHRTAGIMFDIGVFTNLEPDHIGPNEHSSFEEYAACKGKLFRQCRTGIVNMDSEHAGLVLEGHTCSIETYGLKNTADLYADNIIYEHKNGHITTSYDVKGSKNMHVKLRLPGEFSVYNSLCAIAVTEHLDVDDGLLEKALYNVKVPGRVEPVKISDDFTVMVDYAHNAMSLESLLKTLREYNPHRIVTVFGCGGNRSRQRRFEMGKMSDFTVITSDNPRNEEPDMIMQDIETGIAKTAGRYVKIADRAEAIKYAVDNAEKGDIIVVAGKGHEDYQEIKGVKYHMSDRELILKAAGKMN